MTLAPPILSAGKRHAGRPHQHRLATQPPAVRDLEDGRVEFDGYAAVFSERSQGLPFVEVIDPGAFRDCLAGGPDVALVLNHDPGTVIARTTAGNLTLTEDAHGLRVLAQLNPDDPDASRAITKLRDGNWRSMSFMFWDLTPQEERTVIAADGVSERHVKRADIDFGDVAIVTYPAYAGTEAAARALQFRSALLAAGAGHAAQREFLRAFVEDLADVDVAEEELDRRAAMARAAGFTQDDTAVRISRALDELLGDETWDYGWWIRDIADEWVVVRIYNYDADDEHPFETGYYQFPFVMAADGACTFDAPAEVLPRTVYDPVPALPIEAEDDPNVVLEDPEALASDTPPTITLDQARAAAGRPAQ
jgi:HK97 family phage prohead protease